jgi:serine/threonine protein kinase
MSQAKDLEVGSEPFPGYCLARFLGRGGFGEVWEATAPDRGAVALKFLPCKTPAQVARESRSIQSIRQLRHPNLVGIGSVWCVPGYLVFAMELADGTLQDLLEVYENEYGTPIALDHLLPLLGQAAEALDFLNSRRHEFRGHRVAWQHCDVKPSNLLLFGDTLKLSDFSLTSPLTLSLGTQTRQGTPAYMAPEVFQGRLSDRTDQYALAVSYCLARGGRLPFRGRSIACAGEEVRRPPDLTMLPEAERPIVARALAPAPPDRWPSCTELIDQLGRVAPEGWRASDEDHHHGKRPAGLNGKERRTAARYLSQLETSGRSLGTHGQSFAVAVQDIGRRGIGFVSDTRFGQGTILVLSLRDDTATGTLPTYVRVARVNPRTNGAWFLGCTFARAFKEEEVRRQL